MNPHQAARQAALRIANDREEPGDRHLLLTYCGCLWCCRRNHPVNHPAGSANPGGV